MKCANLDIFKKYVIQNIVHGMKKCNKYSIPADLVDSIYVTKLHAPASIRITECTLLIELSREN